MRVISQPDAAAWRSEVTCRGCKSVLEVELSDIQARMQEADGPHPATLATTCTCPVCGASVSVKVPEEFHHALKASR